jgi:hypothetical protein
MPFMVNTPQFAHGKLSALAYKDLDATTYLTSAEASRALEVVENSTFGTLDKTYQSGMADGKVSCSGYWDGSVKAVDEIFNATFSYSTDDLLTFAINGGFKPGARARLAAVQTVGYSATAATGALVSIKTDFDVDGGIFGGRALTDRTPISGTVTYASADFGADFAAATSGAFAHLHITQNTRSTATTYKLQHSVDNSVWVDLAPTLTVNATTTQASRLDITGTVNRYVRVVATPVAGTGTITALVAIARK